MPYKPKKPCAYPGCPELTNARYCEKHKQVVDKQYNLFERDKDSQAFYESVAWRRLRRIKLQTNPICEECLKDNRAVKATTADHIIPIRQGGTALELSNLQSLCGSCHGRKSIEEGSRFGKKVSQKLINVHFPLTDFSCYGNVCPTKKARIFFRLDCGERPKR